MLVSLRVVAPLSDGFAARLFATKISTTPFYVDCCAGCHMNAAAYKRIEDGKALPGLCVIPRLINIGTAVEDLVLAAECSVTDDWVNPAGYFPL